MGHLHFGNMRFFIYGMGRVGPALWTSKKVPLERDTRNVLGKAKGLSIPQGILVPKKEYP